MSIPIPFAAAGPLRQQELTREISEEVVEWPAEPRAGLPFGGAQMGEHE